MATEAKIKAVEELSDKIKRSTITLSLGYQGMLVQEMEGLRNKLRETNTEVKVVKNSLLALAAESTGELNLTSLVSGPTALAFSFGEPLDAAKALAEYTKDGPESLHVQGAYMDGQVINQQDLEELIKLPSKTVMISMIAGQIQSPVINFMGMLDGSTRELATLVQSAVNELPTLIESRIHQLETS